MRSQGRVGKRDITFLARWPSRRAMQHARQRIRDLTARSRLLLPVEVIVADVNRFLRGWSGYFRYGNSARHFAKIRDHAVFRLDRSTSPSDTDAPERSAGTSSDSPAPDQLGLIALHGIVLAPRPFRTWRPTGQRRMPAVNDVGEPCAGEPHARFDGRRLETERARVTAPAADPT